MLRIAIDGRAFQGNRTGIGRYVSELCQELDRQLPDAEFIIYSNRPINLPPLSARWCIRIDSIPFVRSLPSVLWVLFRQGILVRRDNVTLYWGAGGFLPFFIPQNIKQAITVYDLNYLIVPQTVKFLHLQAFRLFFELSVRRAQFVFAISEGTSQRMLQLVGRLADCIVKPACGSQFQRFDQNIILPVLLKYKIKMPYLLAVGTLEPRKNTLLLIKTFFEMKNSGLLAGYKLVLVGGYGWRSKRLDRLIELHDGEDLIRLGFVSDDHLPLLYNGAAIFVFPSIYEGFGMPVLEALKCGIRVVATDLPEIREAACGSDNVEFISPTAEGLKDGIVNTIKKTVCGNVLAQSPTWHEGAKKMVDWFQYASI